MIINNIDAVNHAYAKGKGIIFLGAHYGPELYLYMLYRMHLNVKALLSREFVEHLHSVDTLVVEPFRSKKFMFLNDSGVVIVSHKQEKRILGHLKKGGSVATHLDLPGSRNKAGTTPFLGLATCPHEFFFRIALKYDIPIFFCLFNNSKGGGYLLDFIRSGAFSTPREGFREYISCLEAQINKYPFMWSAIPHFLDWSSCRSIDSSDDIERIGGGEGIV
jgi:lauroyl/myristoyl acyltransferase